jgi:excisionase family DNA binding protein
MISQLTVADAARALGVGRSRVHALIKSGRLRAMMVGVQYLIAPKDLAKVRDRKPGRPAKDRKPGPKPKGK